WARTRTNAVARARVRIVIATSRASRRSVSRRPARGFIEGQLDLHPPSGLIGRSHRNFGEASFSAVGQRERRELAVVQAFHFEVRVDDARVRGSTDADDGQRLRTRRSQLVDSTVVDVLQRSARLYAAG